MIILIPSLWPQGSYNIDGNSNQYIKNNYDLNRNEYSNLIIDRFTFETADFRIVPLGRDLRPTTSQSGFCGVTGNYIEAPVQFFQSFDTNRKDKPELSSLQKSNSTSFIILF